MRFDCGESSQEKHDRLCRWHRVFLFIPRKVGSRDCRWLEYIERKGTRIAGWDGSYWTWEYRPITKEFD